MKDLQENNFKNLDFRKENSRFRSSKIVPKLSSDQIQIIYMFHLHKCIQNIVPTQL